MVGRTVSHYEVIEKLGLGAMGVVYKARDTRLGRTVALKFLAQHLIADEESRNRFLREARTAASLSHPNICTIYEIDEVDEQIFIAMEHIEGRNLQQEMQSRAIEFAEAINIACQVAQALREACEKNVVHRDIKSANIMLTRRRQAKVMDFGLARLVGLSDLTSTGVTLGTLAYMSPEQLEGKDVDHRTDIWALGVVLYEMIAGRLPFENSHSQAIMYSIRDEEPRLVSVSDPRVPGELDDIIQKALSKSVEDRYQDAGALLQDLSALEEPSATRRKPSGKEEERVASLAVLPFVNTGGDLEDEYFSDGLTEDLMSALAQVEGLRVVSRASAFQFKGVTADIRETGRKLRVGTILEGSVRKSGKKLRISAQLVDVSSGFHLWAERFDRALEDVFEVQDEVARAIVGKLKAVLGEQPREPASQHDTEDLEVYELYLKGRYFWHKQTEEAIRKGISQFEQVLALSPQHALAHVGLADCYTLLAWYGVASPDEVIPKAKEASLIAIGLNDSLPLAHSNLALIKAQYDWDWAGAEREFLRALELGPGLAAPHFHYALDYLTPMGRLDEAIAQIRLARNLDPLSLITNTALGGCLYRKRQYDQAIEQFRETLEMDPSFYHAHWSLARALEQKQAFHQAIDSFQEANRLSGGNTSIQGELAHCYGTIGAWRQAQALLDELTELSQRKHISPLTMAFVYLGMSEKDQALEWLEKACEERSRALVWINVDPRFDSLRDDSRFSSVLKRIGLLHLGTEERQ